MKTDKKKNTISSQVETITTFDDFAKNTPLGSLADIQQRKKANELKAQREKELLDIAKKKLQPGYQQPPIPTDSYQETKRELAKEQPKKNKVIKQLPPPKSTDTTYIQTTPQEEQELQQEKAQREYERSDEGKLDKIALQAIDYIYDPSNIPEGFDPEMLKNPAVQDKIKEKLEKYNKYQKEQIAIRQKVNEYLSTPQEEETLYDKQQRAFERLRPPEADATSVKPPTRFYTSKEKEIYDKQKKQVDINVKQKKVEEERNKQLEDYYHFEKQDAVYKQQAITNGILEKFVTEGILKYYDEGGSSLDTERAREVLNQQLAVFLQKNPQFANLHIPFGDIITQGRFHFKLEDLRNIPLLGIIMDKIEDSMIEDEDSKAFLSAYRMLDNIINDFDNWNKTYGRAKNGRFSYEDLNWFEKFSIGTIEGVQKFVSGMTFGLSDFLGNKADTKMAAVLYTPINTNVMRAMDELNNLVKQHPYIYEQEAQGIEALTQGKYDEGIMAIQTLGRLTDLFGSMHSGGFKLGSSMMNKMLGGSGSPFLAKMINKNAKELIPAMTNIAAKGELGSAMQAIAHRENMIKNILQVFKKTFGNQANIAGLKVPTLDMTYGSLTKYASTMAVASLVNNMLHLDPYMNQEEMERSFRDMSMLGVLNYLFGKAAGKIGQSLTFLNHALKAKNGLLASPQALATQAQHQVLIGMGIGNLFASTPVEATSSYLDMGQFLMPEESEEAQYSPLGKWHRLLMDAVYNLVFGVQDFKVASNFNRYKKQVFDAQKYIDNYTKIIGAGEFKDSPSIEPLQFDKDNIRPQVEYDYKTGIWREITRQEKTFYETARDIAKDKEKPLVSDLINHFKGDVDLEEVSDASKTILNSVVDKIKDYQIVATEEGSKHRVKVDVDNKILYLDDELAISNSYWVDENLKERYATPEERIARTLIHEGTHALTVNSYRQGLRDIAERKNTKEARYTKKMNELYQVFERRFFEIDEAGIKTDENGEIIGTELYQSLTQTEKDNINHILSNIDRAKQVEEFIAMVLDPIKANDAIRNALSIKKGNERTSFMYKMGKRLSEIFGKEDNFLNDYYAELENLAKGNLVEGHFEGKNVLAMPDRAIEDFKTPEFKYWFGNWEKNPDKASYITKRNFGQGNSDEPLVVYHGTQTTDLGTWDNPLKVERGNRYLGKNAQGIYFTVDPDYASNYAKYQRRHNFDDGDPNVLPVLLNIRNPLIVEEARSSFAEGIDDKRYLLDKNGLDVERLLFENKNNKKLHIDEASFFENKGQNYNINEDRFVMWYYNHDQNLIEVHVIDTSEGTYDYLASDYFKPDETKKAIELINLHIVHYDKSYADIESDRFPSYISIKAKKILESLGFDGIVYENGEEIIAFDPDQVKSFYNRGTWEVGNPDILAMPDKIPQDIQHEAIRQYENGLKRDINEREKWKTHKDIANEEKSSQSEDLAAKTTIGKKSIIEELGEKIPDEENPFAKYEDGVENKRNDEENNSDKNFLGSIPEYQIGSIAELVSMSRDQFKTYKDTHTQEQIREDFKKALVDPIVASEVAYYFHIESADSDFIADVLSRKVKAKEPVKNYALIGNTFKGADGKKYFSLRGIAEIDGHKFGSQYINQEKNKAPYWNNYIKNLHTKSVTPLGKRLIDYIFQNAYDKQNKVIGIADGGDPSVGIPKNILFDNETYVNALMRGYMIIPDKANVDIIPLNPKLKEIFTDYVHYPEKKVTLKRETGEVERTARHRFEELMTNLIEDRFWKSLDSDIIWDYNYNIRREVFGKNVFNKPLYEFIDLRKLDKAIDKQAPEISIKEILKSNIDIDLKEKDYQILDQMFNEYILPKYKRFTTDLDYSRFKLFDERVFTGKETSDRLEGIKHFQRLMHTYLIDDMYNAAQDRYFHLPGDEAKSITKYMGLGKTDVAGYESVKDLYQALKLTDLDNKAKIEKLKDYGLAVKYIDGKEVAGYYAVNYDIGAISKLGLNTVWSNVLGEDVSANEKGSDGKGFYIADSQPLRVLAGTDQGTTFQIRYVDHTDGHTAMKGMLYNSGSNALVQPLVEKLRYNDIGVLVTKTLTKGNGTKDIRFADVQGQENLRYGIDINGSPLFIEERAGQGWKRIEAVKETELLTKYWDNLLSGNVPDFAKTFIPIAGADNNLTVIGKDSQIKHGIASYSMGDVPGNDLIYNTLAKLDAYQRNRTVERVKNLYAVKDTAFKVFNNVKLTPEEISQAAKGLKEFFQTMVMSDEVSYKQFGLSYTKLRQLVKDSFKDENTLNMVNFMKLVHIPGLFYSSSNNPNILSQLDQIMRQQITNYIENKLPNSSRHAKLCDGSGKGYCFRNALEHCKVDPDYANDLYQQYYDHLGNLRPYTNGIIISKAEFYAQNAYIDKLNKANPELNLPKLTLGSKILTTFIPQDTKQEYFPGVLVGLDDDRLTSVNSATATLICGKDYDGDGVHTYYPSLEFPLEHYSEIYEHFVNDKGYVRPKTELNNLVKYIRELDENGKSKIGQEYGLPTQLNYYKSLSPKEEIANTADLRTIPGISWRNIYEWNKRYGKKTFTPEQQKKFEEALSGYTTFSVDNYNQRTVDTEALLDAVLRKAGIGLTEEQKAKASKELYALRGSAYQDTYKLRAKAIDDGTPKKQIFKDLEKETFRFQASKAENNKLKYWKEIYNNTFPEVNKDQRAYTDGAKLKDFKGIDTRIFGDIYKQLFYIESKWDSFIGNIGLVDAYRNQDVPFYKMRVAAMNTYINFLIDKGLLKNYSQAQILNQSREGNIILNNGVIHLPDGTQYQLNQLFNRDGTFADEKVESLFYNKKLNHKTLEKQFDFKQRYFFNEKQELMTQMIINASKQSENPNEVSYYILRELNESENSATLNKKYHIGNETDSKFPTLFNLYLIAEAIEDAGIIPTSKRKDAEGNPLTWRDLMDKAIKEKLNITHTTAMPMPDKHNILLANADVLNYSPKNYIAKLKGKASNQLKAIAEKPLSVWRQQELDIYMKEAILPVIQENKDKLPGHYTDIIKDYYINELVDRFDPDKSNSYIFRGLFDSKIGLASKDDLDRRSTFHKAADNIVVAQVLTDIKQYLQGIDAIGSFFKLNPVKNPYIYKTWGNYSKNSLPFGGVTEILKGQDRKKRIGKNNKIFNYETTNTVTLNQFLTDNLTQAEVYRMTPMQVYTYLPLTIIKDRLYAVTSSIREVYEPYAERLKEIGTNESPEALASLVDKITEEQLGAGIETIKSELVDRLYEVISYTKDWQRRLRDNELLQHLFDYKPSPNKTEEELAELVQSGQMTAEEAKANLENYIPDEGRDFTAGIGKVIDDIQLLHDKIQGSESIEQLMRHFNPSFKNLQTLIDKTRKPGIEARNNYIRRLRVERDNFTTFSKRWQFTQDALNGDIFKDKDPQAAKSKAERSILQQAFYKVNTELNRIARSEEGIRLVEGQQELVKGLKPVEATWNTDYLESRAKDIVIESLMPFLGKEVIIDPGKKGQKVKHFDMEDIDLIADRIRDIYLDDKHALFYRSQEFSPTRVYYDLMQKIIQNQGIELKSPMFATNAQMFDKPFHKLRQEEKRLLGNLAKNIIQRLANNYVERNTAGLREIQHINDFTNATDEQMQRWNAFETELGSKIAIEDIVEELMVDRDNPDPNIMTRDFGNFLDNINYQLVKRLQELESNARFMYAKMPEEGLLNNFVMDLFSTTTSNYYKQANKEALKMKEGEKVKIFDGKYGLYSGMLVNIQSLNSQNQLIDSFGHIVGIVMRKMYKQIKLNDGTSKHEAIDGVEIPTLVLVTKPFKDMPHKYEVEYIPLDNVVDILQSRADSWTMKRKEKHFINGFDKQAEEFLNSLYNDTGFEIRQDETTYHLLDEGGEDYEPHTLQRYSSQGLHGQTIDKYFKTIDHLEKGYKDNFSQNLEYYQSWRHYLGGKMVTKTMVGLAEAVIGTGMALSGIDGGGNLLMFALSNIITGQTEMARRAGRGMIQNKLGSGQGAYKLNPNGLAAALDYAFLLFKDIKLNKLEKEAADRLNNIILQGYRGDTTKGGIYRSLLEGDKDINTPSGRLKQGVKNLAKIITFTAAADNKEIDRMKDTVREIIKKQANNSLNTEAELLQLFSGIQLDETAQELIHQKLLGKKINQNNIKNIIKHIDTTPENQKIIEDRLNKDINTVEELQQLFKDIDIGIQFIDIPMSQDKVIQQAVLDIKNVPISDAELIERISLKQAITDALYLMPKLVKTESEQYSKATAAQYSLIKGYESKSGRNISDVLTIDLSKEMTHLALGKFTDMPYYMRNSPLWKYFFKFRPYSHMKNIDITTRTMAQNKYINEILNKMEGDQQFMKLYSDLTANIMPIQDWFVLKPTERQLRNMTTVMINLVVNGGSNMLFGALNHAIKGYLVDKANFSLGLDSIVDDLEQVGFIGEVLIGMVAVPLFFLEFLGFRPYILDPAAKEEGNTRQFHQRIESFLKTMTETSVSSVWGAGAQHFFSCFLQGLYYAQGQENWEQISKQYRDKIEERGNLLDMIPGISEIQKVMQDLVEAKGLAEGNIIDKEKKALKEEQEANRPTSPELDSIKTQIAKLDKKLAYLESKHKYDEMQKVKAERDTLATKRDAIYRGLVKGLQGTGNAWEQGSTKGTGNAWEQEPAEQTNSWTQ